MLKPYENHKYKKVLVGKLYYKLRNLGFKIYPASFLQS